MYAVWIDNVNEYRIDDYFDIHPSSAIFTGTFNECNQFIIYDENRK